VPRLETLFSYDKFIIPYIFGPLDSQRHAIDKRLNTLHTHTHKHP
jgi:hypothetical protein